MSGTDNYSGGTTVTGGTLDFATPESMPSTGFLDIESGGEVVLGALLGDYGGESEPAVADCCRGQQQQRQRHRSAAGADSG